MKIDDYAYEEKQQALNEMVIESIEITNEELLGAIETSEKNRNEEKRIYLGVHWRS